MQYTMQIEKIKSEFMAIEYELNFHLFNDIFF